MLVQNWKKFLILPVVVGSLVSCATSDQSTSAASEASSTSIFGFWSSDSEQDTAAHAAIDSATAGELKQLLNSSDLDTVYKAQSKALNAADAGNKVVWRNRFSGAHGTVKSGPVYYVNDRRCRDFKHTIGYDEKTQVIKGSACEEGQRWAALN
ncbi:hypothetical protein PsAD2_00982 [Pseudovibrio axinellae]|uniref:Surface antigen domain-containing protein n=1 Tax=Pseudovibrio axinellae TaxID=989403 RepID=A0A166AF63_9HYPH|nr:RT0821/Lpp0805 family surface protein [Pseudovibrio axinellae]KZL20990.1 hypothetical protein PsAD2_00982 [Pseudovibrio axinellae]SEP79911.1 Surface antigen [Pseudovibrio axinellae]